MLSENGVDELLKHPSKFIFEFAKDVALKGKYPKERRSPPSRILEEFSQYSEPN